MKNWILQLTFTLACSSVLACPGGELRTIKGAQGISLVELNVQTNILTKLDDSSRVLSIEYVNDDDDGVLSLHLENQRGSRERLAVNTRNVPGKLVVRLQDRGNLVVKIIDNFEISRSCGSPR